MSLIRKNEAVQTWQGAKIMLAGDSGVGKTTWAAQDENPLFLCFEDGLAGLPVDYVSIKSYADMINTLDELKKMLVAKTFVYTSIVIDGLDDYLSTVDEMVMAWAKTKYDEAVMKSVQAIGDVPNGTGWQRQRLYCLSYLKEFSLLPAALIVLSHTKQKTIGNGANAYQKTCLNSPSERLGNGIKGFMDHLIVARQTVRGNKKTTFINTDDRMDCIGKSRGSDGKDPKPLIKTGTIWGDNPKENFDNIRQLFQ